MSDGDDGKQLLHLVFGGGDPKEPGNPQSRDLGALDILFRAYRLSAPDMKGSGSY